jgi:hypothetical protein
MKLVGLSVEFCGVALVGFVVTLDVVNELKPEMPFYLMEISVLIVVSICGAIHVH